MADDRRISIIYDNPAVFEIIENPSASGERPLHARGIFNGVGGSEKLYDEAGAEFGVDPNLLKAIAYFETIQGCYDRPPWNKTHRPMNINYQLWRPLALELEFYSEEHVVHFSRANIRMAALLISRIQERIASPNVQKITSIYNFTGAENVTDYGARVKYIYDNEVWRGG